MSAQNCTELLSQLVDRYCKAKKSGQLKDASEETMRTWINELLGVFDWNVQNTNQVLQERTLSKTQREKLRSIGSSYSRPDYTLVNGNVMLAFVDAKGLHVDIENDKNAAFQIRSYGWSIGASFSIITNFEQLAIYDCTVMPVFNDEADYARIYFIKYNHFVEHSEMLYRILERSNVIEENYNVHRNTCESLDNKFSKFLGNIRVKLADSVLKRNPGYELDVISLYVQIIINRIIFIRVCESRGLEMDGLLNNFTENGFWEQFRECSYLNFYEHYDGPMFKRIQALQKLNIDNAVFDEFIRSLYYPSPYRFDVIPLKTISDIYDLFLGYELKIVDGVIVDDVKSEFRRSNGAVTTPERLVKKVIEMTFPSEYFDSLTISDILNLKIIDIACGSGVFLIDAYDFLAHQIENKVSLGEKCDENFVILADKPILTIEGRKKIIDECLYGIDINTEAVEVARMALSLKVIDDYSPEYFEEVGLLGSQILKGVGSNIKCGNSLVDTDIQTYFPEICEDVDILKNTNMFDWYAQFPCIFNKNGGFDFVIGNPPYVEVKNYNVQLPHMAAYIKKVYKSSKNGKIDLAIPFIEKGINLLNEHGRLGYIIQKRFFKSEYGKGIRNLLSSNKLINRVYDYNETDLFTDRITYVAILVCDRNQSNNEFVIYQNSKHTEPVSIPAIALSEAPWVFENANLNTLRLKLQKKLGVLKDICNVKVGVQSLWNNAYQIKVDRVSGGILYGHTAIDENVIVEMGACRALLCNEKFFPLTKREYTTFVIFPYKVSKTGDVLEITMSEFMKLYPKAGAYLMKHRDEILSNVETLPVKNSRYDKSEHWHLFTRANNHSAVYEKICVPMTAQYPQASVVMDKNIYCDNANMFFIQIPEATRASLYALAAIINSTIFSTLARSIANPQQGGYYKFNKQFLDPVPVPVQAFLNCSEDIGLIARIAERIEAVNMRIEGNRGVGVSGLKTSLKMLWGQLDDICNRLYGIDEEERRLLYSVERKDRYPYGEEY